MVTTPPTHRQRDRAATVPRPRVDATLCLSTRTLAWLVPRPLDLTVVESVWNTLAELEAAGHCPRLVTAVRFVLIHHEPTRAGRCRACRRASWRRLWRRRRFPCVVWRQIRGELLGHLSLSSRVRPGTGRSASQ